MIKWQEYVPKQVEGIVQMGAGVNSSISTLTLFPPPRMVKIMNSSSLPLLCCHSMSSYLIPKCKSEGRLREEHDYDWEMIQAS